MVTELKPELDLLSVDDKLDLIGLLWDSIPDEKVPVPEWHLRIIEQRLAEMKEDPDEGQTWEEVKAELERES